VLIVSHDRFILNELVTEVIEVGRGHALRYLGNYDEYLLKKTQMEAAQAASTQVKVSAPQPAKPDSNRNGKVEKPKADRTSNRERERSAK
jgi:ATP-binding cassette, subfamily F, member 3